jgi:hypothetical protein
MTNQTFSISRGRYPWRLSLLCAIAGGLLATCTGCLNPDVANYATGRLFPVVPGEQPFLLIRVINNTASTLDIPIVYDDGTGEQEYIITGLTPEVYETGIVLEWPVIRVALCDLDNAFRPTIIATLPDGSISAVPFGHDALQAGVDYNEGDGIVFSLNADVRSEAYITVNIGLIKASEQPTSFTRADPFEAANLVLLLSGF